MPVLGNNANYVTTLGCSTGLSMGCYVQASDGWYYDGNTGYSYYISGQYVTNIDYAPCSTPAPPPPTPAPITWYAVDLGKRSNTADGACNFAYTAYDLHYYIDASTLQYSTLMRLYSDGTGIPADGYYSDGSYVAYSSNGSLNPVILCAV